MLVALLPTVYARKYITMSTWHLIFISFAIYFFPILIIACDLSHTNRTLYGLRCETSATTDVRQTARPQCVWQCLRTKTCHYINYNSETGQCELGLGQCESLQPAIGVMVNAIGPPRLGCIYWHSSQNVEGEPFQEMDGVRYIGCLEGQCGSIVTFNTGGRVLWVNMEGERIGPISETDQTIEILTKHATCPVPWMPYTTGEPLPVGAVTGGRLPDGSTTYVARITHNGELVFGYYNLRSALAYYEYYGPQTTTSMDILVFL